MSGSSIGAQSGYCFALLGKPHRRVTQLSIRHRTVSTGRRRRQAKTLYFRDWHRWPSLDAFGLGGWARGDGQAAIRVKRDMFGYQIRETWFVGRRVVRVVDKD
jgi:predicted acylesterase/phospholipase RssA